MNNKIAVVGMNDDYPITAASYRAALKKEDAELAALKAENERFKTELERLKSCACDMESAICYMHNIFKRLEPPAMPEKGREG